MLLLVTYIWGIMCGKMQVLTLKNDELSGYDSSTPILDTFLYDYLRGHALVWYNQLGPNDLYF